MYRDALQMVLSCLSERSNVRFRYDDFSDSDWRQVEALIACGLLREIEYTRTVACDGCDEACQEEVVLIDSRGEAAPRAYVICDRREDIARVEVPLLRLRRWQATSSQLASMVATLLDLNWQTEECMRGTLWAVGRRQRGRRATDIFVASVSRSNRPGEDLRDCRRLSQSVRPLVLVPAPLSASGLVPDNAVVVPLVSLLSVSGDRIVIDQDLLDEKLLAKQREEAPSKALLKIAQDGLLVSYAGQRLSLTPLERKTLIALATNPRRALSYYELNQAGWDGEAADFGSIRTVISKLRAKLWEAALQAGRNLDEAQTTIATHRGRHRSGSAYELTLADEQIEID